jgi:class 3 adenylate cyclase
MQQAAMNLSVLVVDIAGQRALFRHVAPQKAHVILQDLFNDLSGVARINNGELQKSFDVGLMCAFISANDAVVAAATMHQIIESRTPVSCENLNMLGLRIRIDTGTVIREGNQLFGDVVRSAILMKTLAMPHQTLISETTLNYLTGINQCQTRFVGSLPANGNGLKLNVFEYLGIKVADTLTVEYSNDTPPARALDVTYGPRILTVDESDPVITIGRLTTNRLVLNYPRVSRRHARIEVRQGKFILVDDSVNGTFVKIGELDTVCLKKDEMQLYGKGLICPGREAASSSPGAIHFAGR